MLSFAADGSAFLGCAFDLKQQLKVPMPAGQLYGGERVLVEG